MVWERKIFSLFVSLLIFWVKIERKKEEIFGILMLVKILIVIIFYILLDVKIK